MTDGPGMRPTPLTGGPCLVGEATAQARIALAAGPQATASRVGGIGIVHRGEFSRRRPQQTVRGRRRLSRVHAGRAPPLHSMDPRGRVRDERVHPAGRVGSQAALASAQRPPRTTSVPTARRSALAR